MPEILANGIKLYYELHGPEDGEVIVLSNGIMMSTAAWGYQTAVLSRHLRVLLYDCHGMWYSEHPTGPYSMEQHADDLVALLDALYIDKAHIAGISYGSEISMVFALRHPERIRSLIVIDGVSQVDPLLYAQTLPWRIAAERKDAELLLRTSVHYNYSESWIAAHQEAIEASIPRFVQLDMDALVPAGLLILTIVSTLIREKAPETILLMNGNWRFLISILVAVASGFLFGAVVEVTLIRPLYVRATFILLMTLGLSYVIRELVSLLWDPLAYQMVRPPLFAQPGKAATILEWLRNGNGTIDIYGVTFPTYRLFVIFLGIIMFVGVTILMTRTRLGMIIRAGVQDPQMVEALGINVKGVFTFVFALGIGLAALGGIGAGPFLPIQPLMGDQYQLQGLITVVIGGMGSYVGAFVGAMILGMARAFGDYFALKYSLSTAIPEASTVIIMIIVLLARPQGLFGKKE